MWPVGRSSIHSAHLGIAKSNEHLRSDQYPQPYSNSKKNNKTEFTNLNECRNGSYMNSAITQLLSATLRYSTLPYLFYATQLLYATHLCYSNYSSLHYATLATRLYSSYLSFQDFTVQFESTAIPLLAGYSYSENFEHNHQKNNRVLTQMYIGSTRLNEAQLVSVRLRRETQKSTNLWSMVQDSMGSRVAMPGEFKKASRVRTALGSPISYATPMLRLSR